jgi:hypothetical protein
VPLRATRREKLGMVLGEPLDQEVEAALAARRAQPMAPAGPAFHDLRKAQEANDLVIRGVLQQAHGGLMVRA